MKSTCVYAYKTKNSSFTTYKVPESTADGPHILSFPLIFVATAALRKGKVQKIYCYHGYIDGMQWQYYGPISPLYH